MTSAKRLFPIFLCLFSAATSAQWAWTDANGRNVYSDRAPPVSVPEQSVFKRPLANTTSGSPESGTTKPEIATNQEAIAALLPASGPRITPMDKALAERKKKAEQAQEAQRKTEEERGDSLKAENCERAKMAKASLDSGVRLSRINQKGDREIFDDAARAVEAARLQAIMRNDCL